MQKKIKRLLYVKKGASYRIEMPAHFFDALSRLTKRAQLLLCDSIIKDGGAVFTVKKVPQPKPASLRPSMVIIDEASKVVRETLEDMDRRLKDSFL